MAYQITYERDPVSFWATNKALLLSEESVYNLPIGLVLGIISAERTWEELSFFTVRHEQVIVGQAMHTGGDKPLLVTRMSPDAIKALVCDAIGRGLQPHKITGPIETAKFCAELFGEHMKSEVSVFMHQGIYELTEVTWPKSDGGTLVCGTVEERELALRYTESFVRECFPEESEPTVRATAMVDRLLPKGHIFFWQTPQGECVSMAARNRETPNTATLSLVYTPHEKRGHGYARLVVSHLSQLWLDRGKNACNLYTDLSNPASNKAYTSVGYEQVIQSCVYQLSKNS